MRTAAAAGHERLGPGPAQRAEVGRSPAPLSPDPPTAAELYAAFHTREPSPRTDFLVLTWMSEATANEMIDAWRTTAIHGGSWRRPAAATESPTP